MDILKTALRIPRNLHAKIIDSAVKNNRTMNAEIVERLEKSFFSPEEWVPLSAAEAKLVASQARDNLLATAKQECTKLITDSARKGLNRADFNFISFAGLSDVEVLEEKEPLYQKMVIPLVAYLTELGYKVEVDGSYLFIDF